MNQYLIEITLGPVQGFIAAARRTRDLWAGSYMLSEMVRATGALLLQKGAFLIYPAESRVRRNEPEENSNLPNILLARVQADNEDAVRAIVQAAQGAARDKLKDFAQQAWGRWTGAGVSLRKEFWDRQLATAIECYASWSLLDSSAGYPEAYGRLKTALASRKNTRAFEPLHTRQTAALAAEGIPKSSLDGLRESVLPKDRKRFPLQFGLSSGEQLDALGAVKRVVGRQETFSALSRIAADSWLCRLSDDERNTLRQSYEPLVTTDVATRTRGNGGIYDGFPYDAGLLYPERLEATLKEVQSDEEAAKKAGQYLVALRNVLKPLWKKYGRPCPYVVMILADGDRMGQLVDRAPTPDAHADISAAIGSFADGVPKTLQQHRSQCIYNGGDDVMGLVPLDAILDVGQALSRSFDETLRPILDRLGITEAENRPSLRVGAAICHVLEPLGHIRRWTTEAEHYAKTGDILPKRTGNALGLRLHIRSGHVVSLRLPFDDPDGFEALKHWMEGYRKDQLPGRLAFDTAAIAASLEAGRFSPQVAEAEWIRLLARAQQSGGKKALPDIHRDALLARLETLGADVSAYRRVGDELRIARWLSATTESDVSVHGG